MLPARVLPWVVAALLVMAITGCDKKSGEGVVLSKEYIAAALPTGETPNTQSVPSPDEQPRAIADDEIAVDGYVMKPEVRGTNRDPRALKHEQWIVKVRMLTTAAHSKSRPIKQNGRNCARTIGSKSGIAQASTPERFGLLRLSESGTQLKRPILVSSPLAEESHLDRLTQ
jgi:hypothetical protein